MVNKKIIVSDIIYRISISNQRSVTLWLYMTNGLKHYIKDVYNADYWCDANVVSIKSGRNTSLNFYADEIKEYEVL